MSQIVQVLTMIVTQRFYLPVIKEAIKEQKEPTMAKEKAKQWTWTEKSPWGRQKKDQNIMVQKEANLNSPLHLDIFCIWPK